MKTKPMPKREKKRQQTKIEKKKRMEKIRKKYRKRNNRENDKGELKKKKKKKDTAPRMYSTASVDGIDEILQVKIYRGLCRSRSRSLVHTHSFAPTFSSCVFVFTLLLLPLFVLLHFIFSYLFISFTVIRLVCAVNTFVFGTLVDFLLPSLSFDTLRCS